MKDTLVGVTEIGEWLGELGLADTTASPEGTCGRDRSGLRDSRKCVLGSGGLHRLCECHPGGRRNLVYHGRSSEGHGESSAEAGRRRKHSGGGAVSGHSGISSAACCCGALKWRSAVPASPYGNARGKIETGVPLMGCSEMRWNITEQGGWRRWVTPQPIKDAARHRWFLFPHSFSAALVEALAEEWKLTKDDKILDPFAGSGTTLVSARTLGIPGVGFDISPLAVLACNGKIRKYSRIRMEERWRTLGESLDGQRPARMVRDYPTLVRKALPDGRLEALDWLWASVGTMDWPRPEREFFELAILAILPRLSHAVANGGWLRWTNQGVEAEHAAPLLGEHGEPNAGGPRRGAYADRGRMGSARCRRAGASSAGRRILRRSQFAAVPESSRLHEDLRYRTDVRVSELGRESGRFAISRSIHIRRRDPRERRWKGIDRQNDWQRS